MKEIIIGKNDEKQRLDRFLRKYLANAPLSAIYKMIRKDVKINGKRGKEDTMLNDGDILLLYISDDDFNKYTAEKRQRKRAKKQFTIAYEDDNILVVEKPFGLLTHGDKMEKKNHLANQVIDYLIEKGDYNPRIEKSFTPASVNRLDRNTTGLVLFGKNSMALKELNKKIRQGDCVYKFYQTIVSGELKEELHLFDKMVKNRETNKIKVISKDSKEGLTMETIVKPQVCKNGYTLVEVQIITGRTHQIRAHLAKAGHPIIGDVKYGKRSVNEKFRREYQLNTQLLHAYKLVFDGFSGELAYLNGMSIEAGLPENFVDIKNNLFGEC